MAATVRESLFYITCGVLCGYALASLLFFDNRLPIASYFFCKLAFCFAVIYGALGGVGGVFAMLVWRGAQLWPVTSPLLEGREGTRGRAGIFLGAGIFALLFFWSFDSFYRYSTFELGLLLKRLFTESFLPVTAYGGKNLVHLAVLLAVSVLVPLLVARVRSVLGRARWQRAVRIAALAVCAAPWGAELYLASDNESGPTLRARPGRKVLVIGVDALDWSYANEYMAEGELPALQSLADKGLFTPLQTFKPAYSPMVWTTIATGMEVADHNIRHFTLIILIRFIISMEN